MTSPSPMADAPKPLTDEALKAIREMLERGGVVLKGEVALSLIAEVTASRAALAAAPAQAETATEDDELSDDDIEIVAKAIAENGIGRSWPDDFHETSINDFDQSDIREYAKAALNAMRRSPSEADALRAALKPFADFAAWIAKHHPGWDHDGFTFVDIPNDLVTMREFRAAARALTASTAAAGEKDT